MRDAVNAFMPPRPIGQGLMAPVQQPVIEIAQSSRQAASINVRLGQIEEQMRVMNGQVEGLQFQLTQMQTILERMQQDYEFRFEQLEGSSSGKTKAAPQSGSVMLPGGAPQNPIVQNVIVTPPPTGALNLDAPDGAGAEFDPSAEGLTLGGSQRPIGTFNSNGLNPGGQSLDLGGIDSNIITDRDADAQYRAGYEAVARGDLEFAEDQFRQFVDLFPVHRQAPEAVNWLGEALLQRGAYDEAVEVFYDGFDAYPNSARAPNLLMNLGIALRGAGEDDTACRTFGEVQKRFSDQPTSFKSQLVKEMRKAQC